MDCLRRKAALCQESFLQILQIATDFGIGFLAHFKVEISIFRNED